jgi:AraC family transcriptional regulator of arabinose operon
MPLAGTDARVRRTIEYLENREYQPARLSELARRVGLGPSRLSHLFKIETGDSLRQFLREARLLRAASLVTYSEERISTICYATGFSDVSNFNHSFKRRFGIAPRQLRRMGLLMPPWTNRIRLAGSTKK